MFLNNALIREMCSTDNADVSVKEWRGLPPLITPFVDRLKTTVYENEITSTVIPYGIDNATYVLRAEKTGKIYRLNYNNHSNIIKINHELGPHETHLMMHTNNTAECILPSQHMLTTKSLETINLPSNVLALTQGVSQISQYTNSLDQWLEPGFSGNWSCALLISPITTFAYSWAVVW